MLKLYETVIWKTPHLNCDYESPNVEQENNDKDVEELLQLLEVVKQQQTKGLSNMDFALYLPKKEQKSLLINVF